MRIKGQTKDEHTKTYAVERTQIDADGKRATFDETDQRRRNSSMIKGILTPPSSSTLATAMLHMPV